eukprot:scaffold63792_cov28-Tisochrysis_lutea.AAC.1
MMTRIGITTIAWALATRTKRACASGSGFLSGWRADASLRAPGRRRGWRRSSPAAGARPTIDPVGPACDDLRDERGVVGKAQSAPTAELIGLTQCVELHQCPWHEQRGEQRQHKNGGGVLLAARHWTYGSATSLTRR